MGFSKYAEDIEELRSDRQYMRGAYDVTNYNPAPKPPFSASPRQKDTLAKRTDNNQIH